MDRVLLDCDSTVYPLLDAMNALPGGERVSYQDCMTWDHLVDLSGGIEQMLDLFDRAMDGAHMLRFDAFEHAGETLRAMAAQGSEIIMVTDRANTFAHGTQAWCTAQRLPVSRIVCERKIDKIAIARELGCGLLIDDHPDLHARVATEAPDLRICSLRFHYNSEAIDTHRIEHATDWHGLRAILVP